jgi:hypothetical protein
MIYLKEFATQADYDAFVESGQMKRPNVSYIEETMAVEYKKPIQYGVFIQHIDGSLLTKEQWLADGYSNDSANGVAVIDEKAHFIIAKEKKKDVSWMQYPYTLIPDIFTTADSAEAKTHYDGYATTQKALAHVSSGAIYEASQYVFPNGSNGYLPAMGELFIAFNKSGTINSLMTLLGSGNYFVDGATWSCTQVSAAQAWIYSFGEAKERNKGETRTALIFGKLSI